MKEDLISLEKKKYQTIRDESLKHFFIDNIADSDFEWDFLRDLTIERAIEFVNYIKEIVPEMYLTTHHAKEHQYLPRYGGGLLNLRCK